jgi:hypothetical protein
MIVGSVGDSRHSPRAKMAAAAAKAISAAAEGPAGPVRQKAAAPAPAERKKAPCAPTVSASTGGAPTVSTAMDGSVMGGDAAGSVPGDGAVIDDGEAPGVSSAPFPQPRQPVSRQQRRIDAERIHEIAARVPVGLIIGR